MEIVLDDYFNNIIQRELEAGHFNSASEVIQAALLSFADEFDMIKDGGWTEEALDKAIQEGIDSGPAEEINWEEFKKELNAEI